MIYIQSNKDRTLPHHFDCACALYGAMDSAMDYRLTTFEEVASGKFDTLIKQNLFVGSTEFMREVFSRIGKTDVRVPKNSNREHKIITLGEARDIVAGGKKIFIKPLTIKLFTGLILDGCHYASLDNIPDDTLVMSYEPFSNRIFTEWRVYVHNHKIVDVKNYSGDLFGVPDSSYINKVITENKVFGFPIAYVIDVGRLDMPLSAQLFDNVIIEYNDMWAIGNYGVPNDLYLKLLKDRYFEIVRG